MTSSTLRRALLAAALFASAAAHAQYGWLDEKGLRQYSDRPPPPSTPASKIFQAPRGATPAASVAAAVPAVAAAPAKPAANLAEREADYKKRSAAAEENEKKAADAQKQAAAKRAVCDSAGRNKESLATGRRMRWSDAAHGNAPMTDEDRARESARIDAVLKDCQ